MIRSATSSDVQEIYELEQCAIECCWTKTQISDAIADDATIFLINDGGYASGKLILDELNINNIVIRPEFRRRGYGAELLGALLKAAKERGASVAFLEVSVENIAAQALYANFGFEVIGERANYYNGVAAKNMKKQL